MPSVWLTFLPLIIVVVLCLTSFIAGRLIESRHFRSLDQREKELSGIVVLNTSGLDLVPVDPPTVIVHGEAVITSDALKRVVGRIKMLVGGEVVSFQTLLERARREAMVRMLAEARARGADAVINVRLASSSIGNTRKKGRTEMVEMYAYGTAVRLNRS